MNCVYCGSKAVTERRQVTARGYRRFRCWDCGRQFKECSNGVLNRTCLPSDIIAFVVFCRLRYRMTLRDLSEIMALRGIEVSHEAIRDWEAKLLPVMGDALRKRRHGTRRGASVSWFVDETYLKSRLVVLPLPGDRPGRKPDRRDAERASWYAGGQGLLPLGADDRGLSTGPGHHRRSRLLPQSDPHRAGQNRPAPDECLSKPKFSLRE
jgi:hypothetical protein